MHIKTGELNATLARLVELTHPLDHLQNFLSVPGPEIHAFQELCRVAVSVEYVIVQTIRFRHVGFDGKDGETHLGGKELQHSVFELKELACAVGRLAERHDSSVANNLFQRFHIGETMTCFGGLEPNGVSSNPFDGWLIRR